MVQIAPGYVAIRYEMIHETRSSRSTAARSRPGCAVPRRFTGQVEGNTLVVETTDSTDQTSIGANGNGARQQRVDEDDRTFHAVEPRRRLRDGGRPVT